MCNGIWLNKFKEILNIPVHMQPCDFMQIAFLSTIFHKYTFTFHSNESNKKKKGDVSLKKLFSFFSPFVKFYTRYKSRIHTIDSNMTERPTKKRSDQKDGKKKNRDELTTLHAVFSNLLNFNQPLFTSIGIYRTKTK